MYFDDTSLPSDLAVGDPVNHTVRGEISSPLHQGTFEYQCEYDGSVATAHSIDLPDPAAVEDPVGVPAPSPDLAPAPSPTTVPTTAPGGTVTPVDPRRIDPDNDSSGRTGRDDNLGIYYHNMVDWRFLERPGAIVPGGRMHNVTSSAMCSIGFIASTSDRLFVVTAGHCGNVGDQFLVEDSQGGTLVFGEMVESFVEYAENKAIVGADIGLIEIYPDARPHVHAALPASSPLKGWITPQEAQRRGMAICRLGATTGYSCGKFEEIGRAGQFYYRGISDRGDSGGVVFALEDTGAWGIGVVSNVADTNKTYAGAMEIAGAMQHWVLQLHG